jgi:hypothetical protein
MSVTSVEITQDNIVSSCNLLATHQPLVFIIEALGTDLPDYLTINVKSAAITLGIFKAVSFEAISGGRNYIFNADSILRCYMPHFDDTEQTNDTIELTTYPMRSFMIEVTHEALSDEVAIVGYLASRQRGKTEALTEIYGNDNEKVFCFKDRYTNFHYYKQADTALTLAFGTLTASVTKAGLYRAKRKITTIGASTMAVGTSGSEDKTITIECLPDCSTGLYLKFLDSNNGYYKHWLFNRHYGLEGASEDIGEVLNPAINLTMPSRKAIGKRSTKQYILTADNITSEMLTYLNPIGTSPRVYVYIASSWVLCKVEDAAIPFRFRKGNAGDYSIVISLPEQYNVTML